MAPHLPASPTRVGALLALPLLAACASPGEGRRPGLTLYGGRYTDTSLPEEILIGKKVTYEDAWLASATWAEPLSVWGPFDTEWEVGVAQHFGEQDHQELNALFLLRYEAPWSASLPTSLAIGEGLSWASEVPPLESASHTNTGSRQLLNHLVLEATVGPPRADWQLILRIHHRSGVFGLFDGVIGGSNVIALGVRWFF